MSCNYRIKKPVYIGQGVRKTKDKTTVEFANEPMKGVKILSYNELGFYIEHPDLPKRVWVTFDQLPLTELVINNGVIEDEITFVEGIVGTSFMYFIRTDTDEYRELVDDKNVKDKLILRTIKDLVPGDRCMSALCTDGTEMIFLGVSYKTIIEDHHVWNYSNSNKNYYMPSTPIKRAMFLVISSNGKHKYVNYPVTNKTITELLLMSDYRDSDIFNEEYSNINKNIDMIMHNSIKSIKSYYLNKQSEYDNIYESHKGCDNMEVGNNYRIHIYTLVKKDMNYYVDAAKKIQPSINIYESYESYKKINHIR